MPEQTFPKIENFKSHSLLETEKIGRSIATDLIFPACVYLQGDLGAGKTTLCKSIIQNLGYDGIVTSPTYNLIQEYPVAKGIVYHMDLYRLQDPAELEFLGLTDLWASNSIFLIEWPTNGQPFLPKSTHMVEIDCCNGDDTDKKISFITLKDK